MDPINYTQQLANYRTDLQGTMNPNGIMKEETIVDEAGKTFSDYFGQAISQIDEKVQMMNQDTMDVITGGEVDLAQVMINMSEAQLTLQTATQVRNKCLEAYNDIKSMQFQKDEENEINGCEIEGWVRTTEV